MSDSFYRAYEDRHRGSRELIKSRLLAYKPFLTPLASLHSNGTAIDLGCGRGEWLEVLGESGFAACGVDLDEGMLAACRDLGLNARHADALESLRALPDESTALVSAFHVVEHMPFDDVRSLIGEALRVLKPGGLLILETPNPENLVVGACSFYQDPSHVRPVPPELLNFVVEYVGFHRNKMMRLQEAPALHTSADLGLLDVLNGVSPDYSIVAQKAAAPAMLSGFDDAFRTDYGLSLTMLAQRFDQQIKGRLSDARNSLAWTEAQHRQAVIRLSYMDERMAQLEARTAHVETLAMQADARAAQLGAQLHAVLHSRSWRITAPLRFAGKSIYRFRSAVREGRLASGIKRRIKPALRRVGQEVQQRPRLRQTVLWMIARFPGLEHRLRNVMGNPPGLEALPSVHKPGDLSPRAMLIYTELKKAIEARKN